VIKVLTWFRRRPDLELDAFLAHWQGPHAELALRLPGLRAYVQNPVHPSSYARGRRPAFDGVAETWFDDPDAVRAVGASAEYQAVVGDERRFMDVGSPTAPRHVVLTTERVVVDGEPPVDGAVKQFSFVRRRPDLPLEEFRRYWWEVHGQLAVGLPGLVRYVQCVTTDGIYRAGREPDADGVTVVWFESFDAMRATPGTPALRAIVDDQDAFLDVGALVSLAATERRYL
jgi:uncharacterized protein (TIGR02118 family)